MHAHAHTRPRCFRQRKRPSSPAHPSSLAGHFLIDAAAVRPQSPAPQGPASVAPGRPRRNQQHQQGKRGPRGEQKRGEGSLGALGRGNQEAEDGGTQSRQQGGRFPPVAGGVGCSSTSCCSGHVCVPRCGRVVLLFAAGVSCYMLHAPCFLLPDLSLAACRFAACYLLPAPRYELGCYLLLLLPLLRPLSSAFWKAWNQACCLPRMPILAKHLLKKKKIHQGFPTRPALGRLS